MFFSPIDQFAVSPGIHIQDLTYTFNSRVTPAPFPKAQRDMQQAIASFVLTGVPSLGNGTVFPRWGEDRSMVEITTNGGQIANSQVNETRCAWWSDLGA